MKLLAAAFACSLFLALATFAQTNAGTVTGSVSDRTKTPVPGASIQFKNVESGTVYKGTSLPPGNYSVAQLPPGKYELLVTSFGFKPYERKDIVVQAGQTLRLDIPLGDFISLDTLGEDRAGIGRLVLTRRQPPAGPTPRTTDGKPDLTGVWYGPLPNTDQAELLPWAQALVKERLDNNLKDAPQSRCLPFNVAPVNGFFFNTRLLQSKDLLLAILEYDVPGYRQIYLDGRPHPKDLEPSWNGHSVGKWDGDTLVIETVGFNDKTWISEANPHTDKLKVITRLHRTDLGHMEIETTYDDPGSMKKPWTVKGIATLAPATEEIPEFICTENNQDVEHLVGK